MEDRDEQDPVAHRLYLVLMRISAIYKAIKKMGPSYLLEEPVIVIN